MSDTSAVRKQSVTLSATSKFVEEAREKLEKAQESLTADNDSEFSIRSGSALKTLRISAPSPSAETIESGIRATRRNEPTNSNEYIDVDNEPVLMLTPSNKKTFRRNPAIANKASKAPGHY